LDFEGFARRTDSRIGVRHFVRRIASLSGLGHGHSRRSARIRSQSAIMFNRPRMAKTLAFEPRALNPDAHRRRGKREFRGSPPIATGCRALDEAGFDPLAVGDRHAWAQNEGRRGLLLTVSLPATSI